MIRDWPALVATFTLLGLASFLVSAVATWWIA